MNTRKVIGARHPFFNCTLGRQQRMICLAIAVLLIGVGGAFAQTSGMNTSRANRAKPAPQASKVPPAPSAEDVSQARRRLAELGYWVKAEGGDNEASLRHALIAFQKIES